MINQLTGNLLLEAHGYITPILKKVNSKRHSIICKVCWRRLELEEEYIWFHTHDKDIINYLKLKTTAKSPGLNISLCIKCWLKEKEKLIKLTKLGYKVLRIKE